MSGLFKVIKSNIPTVFISTLIFGCLALNTYLTNPPSRLTVDGATLAVMAEAPFKNLGSPYKDYWEFKPPGVMLLVGGWGKLFNFSLPSYQLLQFLSLLGISFLSYFIFKKAFSLLPALIISTLYILLFYSPYFKFGFLVAEIYGLLFSLIGLAALLYIKDIKRRFFLSTFFLIFAGQLKDPFIFVPFALLPYVLAAILSPNFRSRLKPLFWMAAGTGTVALTVIAYLIITGSLKDYMKVKHVESYFFGSGLLTNPERLWNELSFTVWHSRNILTHLHYPIAALFLFWFSSLILLLLKLKRDGPVCLRYLASRKIHTFYLRLPKMKISANSPSLKTSAILFYSIGSFLGFMMQAKFDFHHLVQVVFPLFFLIAVTAQSTVYNIAHVFNLSKLKLLLIPALLMLLLPKEYYLKGYNVQNVTASQFINGVTRNTFIPNPVTPFEDYIASKTDKNGCILGVYGWAVSTYYYYTERQPCTRYFLTGTVGFDSQKQEYRDSLLNNPPQAVILSTDDGERNGAQFEKEVINISKILQQCYSLDSRRFDLSVTDAKLYFPRYKNEDLKKCLKDNS